MWRDRENSTRSHDPIHRYDDLSKEALIKTSKQRLDKSCPSNEYMRHIPPSKKGAGATPMQQGTKAKRYRQSPFFLSFTTPLSQASYIWSPHAPKAFPHKHDDIRTLSFPPHKASLGTSIPLRSKKRTKRGKGAKQGLVVSSVCDLGLLGQGILHSSHQLAPP